jgi:alcohol dehydrogenase class IV
MTDAICREGMQRAATWLRTACEEGRNTQARENMSLASLFGGLALTNAGLGAVHGIAAPLGGAFPVPHGVVCARLLPWVMDANIKALSARAKDSPALKRYDEVARILIGKLSAHAGDGVAWIHSLCTEMAIPGLSSYGLTSEDLPAIVEQAMKASSMRGNPITLTAEELTGILHDAL